MVDIKARTWTTVVGSEVSEADCGRHDVWQSIDIDRCALVVIDPWERHENHGHNERLKSNIPSLVKLIHSFRRNRRPVFYDSTGLPIHPLVLEGASDPNDIFIAWDRMGGGSDVLNNALVSRNINVLFWAGYDANLCLMSKPCGFRTILKKDWDRFHFLARDATIAFESDETLAEQRLLDATCYEVEYYPRGFSCLVDDVTVALASNQPAKPERRWFGDFWHRWRGR